jgi:hypothetical protein
MRRLEREDGNLRRALRTPSPRAAQRIQLEIDVVANELAEGQARLGRLEEIQQPMRITPKLIRDTIEEMSGLLEHAALDTRVAWTAARSTRWPSGRRRATTMLTGRLQ